MDDWIWMPFWGVSGVSRGMSILDGGPHPREEMEVLGGGFFPIDLDGVLYVFLKQKCIRLVRENLRVFPSGKYINIIVIY